MIITCYKSKLAVLLVLVLMTASAFADKNWKESGNSKATKAESCVAPVDEMRRNHMEMIQHQRDMTVRHGIRKTDDALSGCVDCHANYDEQGHGIAVNAPGQFCSGCHNYVAASLDCFSCHATAPEKGK